MLASNTKLRRALPALGTAFVAALSLACGGDNGGPSAPSGSGDDVSPPVSTTGIRVTNASSRSAWYVYFKSCGTDDWGEDRLGSSNVLSRGESVTSEVPAGCYDVLALTDTSERPYYQIHLPEQSVAEGQLTSISLSSGDWQSVVSEMVGLSMGRK